MPYLKICPVCKKEFEGRKNKVYCSFICKSHFNNNKATVLRSELIDSKAMLNNFRILKEFYELTENGNPIKIGEFYKKGFNFEGPSRKITSPKKGYKFYLIHSYAFRIITQQGKQYIAVYKKDEINNI